MEKYDKYKETGIKWINVIPKHWKVGRIKDLAKIKGGQDQKKVVSDNGRYPVYGSGGIFGKATKYLYNKESVLLGRKGTIDKPLFVKKPFWTVDTMYYTQIYNNTCPKFFYYRCICINFDLYQYGSAIPSMTQGDLININFAIPPLKEQTQIANHLDTKTKAIDQKISLLQQKITHYKAYRKTLINETVTKGLDKSVKLKDSGIEWIGEIPEHWEVKRLKDISNIFTGNSISDKSIFENKENTYDYIATKDINIHTKYVNYDNGVYIPKTNNSFKITKENTCLVCLEGASAGKKLTFVDRKVAFVNKLCAIKSTNNNVLDKYIFYFLQTRLFRSQFFELLSGLIGGVSLGLLKYFNLVIPSYIEQQQIANFLDTKTATIDKIINNIETQISTLKELRKTLINEVVTGKVKVVN